MSDRFVAKRLITRSTRSRRMAAQQTQRVREFMKNDFNDIYKRVVENGRQLAYVHHNHPKLAIQRLQTLLTELKDILLVIGIETLEPEVDRSLGRDVNEQLCRIVWRDLKSLSDAAHEILMLTNSPYDIQNPWHKVHTKCNAFKTSFTESDAYFTGDEDSDTVYSDTSSSPTMSRSEPQEQEIQELAIHFESNVVLESGEWPQI